MRIRIVGIVLLGLALFTVSAAAETISFTAGDIKAVMASAQYQDPLSEGNFIWGLWSIRAMPIVSGGGFDIISGGVNSLGANDFWAFAAPDPQVVWADPYGSESAYFFLKPASEHLGVDAHPLYFIADQDHAAEFQTYAFDNATSYFGRSAYKGVCGSEIKEGTEFYSGCNFTNILPDTVEFSFTFNLGSGASLLGWQFLVDGSKYYSSQPEGRTDASLWIEDFIGGGMLPPEWSGQTNPGDGLTNNVGNGYQVLFPVPEPSTLILVGLGFAALVGARRRV